MSRRNTVMLSSLLVFLVFGLGAFYLARNPEHEKVDKTARASAGPGARFVHLSDGITQYELSGSDAGRTVVLCSGATVPYYLWDPTRDALAANGFRVLRYNYYGRGFSDRPTLAYDLATYDRQLSELLDSLGIHGPVDIGGVSMGGVIATSFADRHPKRVRSLILVDPAFGNRQAIPFPLGVPGVGEYVMTTMGSAKMAPGQLTDFLHPELHPDWVSRYRVQMRYKGFLRAILATYRGDVGKRPAASFTAVVHNQIPILLIWGKQDHTVPFARSDTVRMAFARAEFHAIDSAAHLPQIEQAATVDSILVRFLRSH
jgi:pimeloyl-ACP methyl ester carboxylesterase